MSDHVSDSERRAASVAMPAVRRLGIVGGGQLATMLALAGTAMGLEVHVLERRRTAPALRLASSSILGDWDDPACLLELGSRVEVVTLENEFVDADGLRALEQAGHRLYPSAASIAVVQDKLVQKQTLAAAGLPVQAFRAVGSVDEIAMAAAELGWPLVLKTRRHGYDGKGNVTLQRQDEAASAWSRLGGDSNGGLYVEAYCHFKQELATIITTGPDGGQVCYPLVASFQQDHICHVVHAPAPVPAAVSAQAMRLARDAVNAVGGVGSFGVELFLGDGDDIRINELAPRVHNSGHYSIEACVCSQFENHVRAVCGWPLGSVGMLRPVAVMVNLLGDGAGDACPRGLQDALALPGVHVHDYGKECSAPGRKMGHVTVLGEELSETDALARQAAGLIRFGGPA